MNNAEAIAEEHCDASLLLCQIDELADGTGLREIDERLRAQADLQEDPTEGLVRLERELGLLRAGATLGTREPTDARW